MIRKIIYILAIMNGVASPHILILVPYMRYIIPFPIFPNNAVNALSHYLASLMIACLSLMISGILPAIYEHMARPASPKIRDLLWLLLMLLLSLPSFLILSLWLL